MKPNKKKTLKFSEVRSIVEIEESYRQLCIEMGDATLQFEAKKSGLLARFSGLLEENTVALRKMEQEAAKAAAAPVAESMDGQPAEEVKPLAVDPTEQAGS